MLRQSQRPQTSHCPFPGCVCTEGGPDGVSGYPPRKLSTFDSEPLRYATHAAQRPPPSSSGPIPPMRSAYTWDDRDREDTGSPHGSSSASASVGGSPARKHARSWDSEVRISLSVFFPISRPGISSATITGAALENLSIVYCFKFFFFSLLLTRDTIAGPPDSEA